MPEIPEMEIYRNFLKKHTVGKTIVTSSVERERSINVRPEIFSQWVENSVIQGVERRGKLLLIHLSTGKYLLTHMMLDGRIYLESPGTKPELPGKSHVRLDLDDGTILHFCELRLGYIKLLDPPEVDEIISELGLEPLGPDYTTENFLTALERKRGMLKPLLMDQRVIAGIGNAYSNETLFAAGLHPERKVSTLKEEEREILYRTIPEVLRLSIEKGGYIEDPFAAWDTLTGGFIPYFQVYDRTGKPCLRCGSLIEQKVVGGRNAYFCNKCQH